MFKARTSFIWLCLSNALSIGGSVLDTANWMKDHVTLFGFRTLRQLCIPGSHNSGMNELNGGTAFARRCNTLNQSQSVLKQLELGVRYFDVRPVISGGRFMTGHYTKIIFNSWQGGNGQSIYSIVSDINTFTRYHNELIIVRLSHTLNTDVGNRRYRGFIKEEWDGLFRLLDDTNYMVKASPYTVFYKSTVVELTKNGTTAAVLYIVDALFAGVFLGKRVGNGYFYRDSLNPFDKFSDSNKLSTMSQDQIMKMETVSPLKYFLLSWTLTQSYLEASICPLEKSIYQLAEGANRKLKMILSEVTWEAFPNIISIDFVETPALAEIVMAVNSKLF
ncbi:unnamed protein product [Nezara viridula]|uniref:Uncharacterized protein n=1 Tax=Nezara viridula TaxID=85310 RepID=A0A9P0E612_NEZVI|nr:unnamed protein product [Nezara viridula]